MKVLVFWQILLVICRRFLYTTIKYPLKIQAKIQTRGRPRAGPDERMLYMIKLQSEKGAITISSAVFSNITGNAATNCFGVKGMAFRSMTDGLVHLLRKEAMSKGVQVIYNEDATVSIRLHIIVEHGINITAVCRSIMSEVQYKVSKYTGIPVKSVDVCVDSVVSNAKGV